MCVDKKVEAIYRRWENAGRSEDMGSAFLEWQRSAYRDEGDLLEIVEKLQLELKDRDKETEIWRQASQRLIREPSAKLVHERYSREDISKYFKEEQEK